MCIMIIVIIIMSQINCNFDKIIIIDNFTKKNKIKFIFCLIIIIRHRISRDLVFVQSVALLEGRLEVENEAYSACKFAYAHWLAPNYCLTLIGYDIKMALIGSHVPPTFQKSKQKPQYQSSAPF